MLTNALVNNIAFKALTLMGFIPIWILLFFAYKPEYSTVTLTNILVAIPALIMGFFIGFLLTASVTSLAFWTTRVYSIHEFYYAMVLLFSGLFVPLSLMPKVIQDVAQYLPFQLSIYYPIELILGRLSSAQIIQGYVTGVVWLMAAIVIFNLMWRRGVKRYSAVGA
jgi:ABC-2 type transport system permease protein